MADEITYWMGNYYVNGEKVDGDPTNGAPSEVINSDGTSSIIDSNGDDLLNLLQTQDSPESALQWLKINNPEVYYQILAERDTNRDYWEQYRDYQSDYYSIMKDSLEKAGMNPWLALQNFGSIGTGSVGSSSSINPTNTLKAQREAKKSDIYGKAIGAGATILAAILGAIIMAAL